MPFIDNLLHHPRRLWLRRALFQIHLWAGVLVAVYLVVIALSGSVLVFKDELTRWSLPPMHAYDRQHMLSPEQVVAMLRHSEPAATLSLLQAPTTVLPAYLLEGKDRRGRTQRWLADPVTGALHPVPRTWLDWMHDLHYYLLLPTAYGMQVNAVGGAVLLLLAASGLALWWPGVRLWTRGLRVNLRAGWKRVNYDLHSAIGFWTLLIVSWWALSGVYFGFYKQVVAAASLLSPVEGMRSPVPVSLPQQSAGARPSLQAVLQAAQTASPHGTLWSVSDPMLRSGETYVLMDLRAPGDFSHRDIVRVRTADARVLSVWHYGERHTFSDWFLWSMHPLHFGTLWGLPVKIVWALLGVALAVLTVTGLLMYWNRYLRLHVPHFAEERRPTTA